MNSLNNAEKKPSYVNRLTDNCIIIRVTQVVVFGQVVVFRKHFLFKQIINTSTVNIIHSAVQANFL